MTKKVFSKAIAIVCVAALCLTAAFAGTVSAATRTAACTMTGSSYDPGANNSYVTATATFESATNFVAGSFTVDPGSNLTFLEASLVADGVVGTLPHVYMKNTSNVVLFACFGEDASNDFNPLGSLTIALKFAVKAGSLEKVAAGTVWTVGLNNIKITNQAEEVYTTANASTTIHVHNFNGTETTNSHIKTTACSVAGCTEVKTEVLDAASLIDNDLDTFTKTANVTFTNDGEAVLNALLFKSSMDARAYDDLYFVYQYKDDDEQPKTAVARKEVLTYQGKEYYAFPCRTNGGIGRACRPITGNFVAVKDGTTSISGSTYGAWTYSVLDYASSLWGNAMYTTEEKNYGGALLNYSKRTVLQLGHDYDIVNYYQNNYTWFAGPITPTYATPASSKATANGATDPKWSIVNATVTTGYKPTMNITFSAATPTNYDSLTVKVFDNSNNLLYSKEVAFTNVETVDGKRVYHFSDLPTKYLIYDIVIGVKKSGTASPKTITYSYGRYTRNRLNADASGEGALFQSLMDYSVTLATAFPG